MASEKRRIHIFDTTLRDGEQSPGVSLNAEEKLEIAEQLDRLNVDVIEAGFPIASPGDFEAVQEIARSVYGPTICALARVHKADIDKAWEAIRDAVSPRIHTFVSTSDIHITSQMNSTREDVKGMARAAVALAKGYCEDIEFSPMDATRADWEFTAEVCAIAIEEGATVINIPDTVGYSTPGEYERFLRFLVSELPELGNSVELSVHCHNDLGLAVANSLAGIAAGATQIECAVNGIGERAGNASLEEVVMALRTRSDDFDADTKINTFELAKTSRLVSRLTGYSVPPNKAIVGANAFSHESGIHQDGVLKNPATYEIIDPTEVGIDSNNLVLGKHSGRHAVREALETLGYELTGSELNEIFLRFKELADRKKTVTRLDLEALVVNRAELEANQPKVEWFEVQVASSGKPRAEVIISDSVRGKRDGEGEGDGTMDAVFVAINDALMISDCKLSRYTVDSVTEGTDALAQVTVVVENSSGIQATGHAVATDTVAASAEAYLRAALRLP